MALDPQQCYRAVLRRDARFDGRFFTAVRTTGVFCRPICPARPAKAANCRFFPTAVAAMAAGFRPCRRCRPEAAPGSPAWNGSATTVGRAVGLIEGGALDHGGRVGDLAARLGVGERQLRRLFARHLGAGPLAVARAQRLLTATRLLADTDLPIAQIALACGYSSLRRFNDAFRTHYGGAPRDMRHHRLAGGGTCLRLSYRPPFDWAALCDFFAARAVTGVERVCDRQLYRVLDIDGVPGWVAITHDPARHQVRARVCGVAVGRLPALGRRLRRLLDLDADPEPVRAHLAGDPLLAPIVARNPGLRLPGSWGGFEIALRAVLGQQVSLSAARQLLSRLVAAHGHPTPAGFPAGLTMMFPRAEDLAGVTVARLRALGLPRRRAETVLVVAELFAAQPGVLEAATDLEGLVARLQRLPGIGPWSAHYIALRGAGLIDAFPAADAGLLRAAGMDRADLTARAAAWRPWRGYAAQWLWYGDAVMRE